MDALRLYLETSYWSRLVDRQDPERRRATRRFDKWAKQRHYLLASDLVWTELDDTRDESLRRQALRKYDRTSKKIIPSLRRVRSLAWELVRIGCVTENHLADATHMAYSIVGGADVLVTWDVEHLAREHTRRLLAEYCWRQGVKAVRIGTPIEVGQWLDIRIQ